MMGEPADQKLEMPAQAKEIQILWFMTQVCSWCMLYYTCCIMLENTCKQICIMSTYVYWRVYCLLTVSTFTSIGPCRAMFFWNVRRPCGDAAWQLDDVSALLKIFRFCQPFGSCGVLKKSDRKHLQNNAKTYLEIQTRCPKHVSIIVIMSNMFHTWADLQQR